jgi:hypothetical protein
VIKLSVNCFAYSDRKHARELHKIILVHLQKKGHSSPFVMYEWII